jgi:hypothetical protein
MEYCLLRFNFGPALIWVLVTFFLFSIFFFFDREVARKLGQVKCARVWCCVVCIFFFAIFFVFFWRVWVLPHGWVEHETGFVSCLI